MRRQFTGFLLATLAAGCVSHDTAEQYSVGDITGVRTRDQVQSAASSSTVVYSNLGPGGSFDTSNAYDIAGIDLGDVNASRGQTVSQQFTAPMDAVFTNALLPLVLLHGTNRPVAVDLVEDAGGLPRGATLEHFVTTSLPFLRICCAGAQLIEFISSVRPVFTAGSKYWLVVYVPDPETTDTYAGWVLSMGDTSPGFVINGSVFYPGSRRAAFQINGQVLAPPNEPPLSMAGANQTVRPGAPVQLNGSGSLDDNTATNLLVFSWTLVSKPTGSAVVLASASSMTPTFTPDVGGSYLAQLVVTDQAGLSSAPSEVLIEAIPPPTANAGLDQLVIVNQTVNLAGSASAASGETLTYRWVFITKPTGSTSELATPNLSTTEFVPDLPGVYLVALLVSDGIGAGTPDQAQITAVTAAEYANTQVQLASAVVEGLPSSAVTNGGNANALAHFLENATVALGANDLAEAATQLRHAIGRTDGCALQGAPDGSGNGRDWVTTCSAQNQIYPLLVAALAAITP